MIGSSDAGTRGGSPAPSHDRPGPGRPRRPMAVLVSAAILLGVAGRRVGHAQAPEPPGKIAFTRVCRVCHGAEGRGDAAPRLVPFDRDVEEVLGIVRDGRGDMPPISTREVSDREVADIVAFLKSLTSAKGAL